MDWNQPERIIMALRPEARVNERLCTLDTGNDYITGIPFGEFVTNTMKIRESGKFSVANLIKWDYMKRARIHKWRNTR